MNDAFSKDIAKAIKNTQINQELSPGATGRRYEPAEGEGNLKKRIHKESKYVDTYGNLQYSFRKPYKPTGRNTYVSCDICGKITMATTTTKGIICRECGLFSSVSEVVDR